LCPAKTARRPVAPLSASLVALREVGGWRTLANDVLLQVKAPPLTRVLSSSCQASTEFQENGWQEVPLQDSRALALLGNFTLLNQAHTPLS
jgi:hypothetical protein